MSPILEENDDGSQRDENGPKFPLRKEQGQDVYPGLGDPGAGALSLSLQPQPLSSHLWFVHILHMTVLYVKGCII